MATSSAGTYPDRTSVARPSLVSVARAHGGLLLVVVVALGLAVWRLAFVLGGVDPDSDAYGHHAIARQILVTPRDLTVHWVWLPLFHYLQAAAVALGATLQTVRIANVVVATVTPIALTVLLRRHRELAPETRWDPAPLVAGLLASLSPIAMQMGTTGQTEPLFALLVVAFLHASARGAPGFAALALVAAVLLRYEAWALPPALAIFLLLCRVPAVRARLHPWERNRSTEGASAWLPVVLPIAAIFAWAGVRRATIDPTWFAFLKETRQFAASALGTKSAFDLGWKQVAIDLGYYAVKVPWRVVGYPLLLVPFGIVRTFRREGLRFVLVFGALLGFVTLTWLMRSTLGLERHFVVLVPFYATMIANGIVAIGAFVDEKITRPSIHAFAASGALRAAIVAGLGCAVVANTSSILDTWMNDWRGASDGAWPDRRAIAGMLAELPAGTIFCDEPTVEIMSGLERTKFDRRQLADPRAPQWVREATARGPVYVATWAVRLAPLGVRGRILARSPGTSGDIGFVLMQVARD